MIRVFFADDHALVREGMRRILGQANDLVVVGEASDGDGVKGTEQRFDVLVLDLAMPGPSGVELIQEVKKSRPDAKIVVVSMHPERELAVRVLRAGADGYVEKGRAAREVVEAIRTVARGGKHVSPEVAAQLIEHKTGAPHDSLTDKELAVLQALGRGETPSEIAIAMGLSASTVSTHIARMRTKLGARSLGDLIRYALKNALVE